MKFLNVALPILLLGWMPTSHVLADSPNVVILFTDDQGTLDANCYGSTDLQTPHIDRLATTGIRFSQAYAHTVCTPSRAALLTGRYPQRSGMNEWGQADIEGEWWPGNNMALEEVTLAEALKSAGYRTALFGKWHLGAHRDFGPKKQGFDEFFGPRCCMIDNYNHYFLHGDGFHDLYEGTQEVHADGKYFPELMVRRSLQFIDQNQDHPFLLYVAFNIPHYPEGPLKQYETTYRKVADAARRSYAAVISTMDHYIGQIVNRLETLGLREDTIIVFMSDNGHSMETGYRIRSDHHRSGLPKGHFYGASGGGNTGKWIGQKGSFLEGGIRVPAIISYPSKLPKGEVRNQVITVMDWYSTILALCNVKTPDVTLDGYDLGPVIHSPYAPSPHDVLHFQWRKAWAVREGAWKLIGRDDSEKVSLYNLADEWPERTDYSERKPKIVARLSQLHVEWARGVFSKHSLLP